GCALRGGRGSFTSAKPGRNIRRFTINSSFGPKVGKVCTNMGEMRSASSGLQLHEKSSGISNTRTLSLFSRNRRRSKFGRESIEAELPTKVAARTRGELIQPVQPAHHPVRVNSPCDACEFLRERRVAKLRRINARSEFEKV